MEAKCLNAERYKEKLIISKYLFGQLNRYLIHNKEFKLFIVGWFLVEIPIL